MTRLHWKIQLVDHSWILHTQLSPCLYPQHQTLQVWCNPSVHLAKLSQPAVLSEAYPSCICYFSLDQVLGIFCVLLKTSYWLQTLTLNSFTFHDSRGSDDGGKCQEVLSFSHPALDTILKLLQSPETQGIKYKKETIITFRIPSTPFCLKTFQNPTNDVFPYQVLPIKDDMFSLPLSSRIFFLLLLSFS